MGVGNVLMSDDALGPWILKSLEAQWEFPHCVSLFDAGTPGLDLTLFLDGADALIAVDALKAKGAPGEVRTYRRDELLKAPLPIVMSPHEPTLREALVRLDMLGRCPKDVFVVGAIPERVETGTGLSPTVRGAIPSIETQIVRELTRLGAAPIARSPQAVPDVWWEKSAGERRA